MCGQPAWVVIPFDFTIGYSLTDSIATMAT